jgi:hypothetical protein
MPPLTTATVLLLWVPGQRPSVGGDRGAGGVGAQTASAAGAGPQRVGEVAALLGEAGQERPVKVATCRPGWRRSPVRSRRLCCAHVPSRWRDLRRRRRRHQWYRGYRTDDGRRGGDRHLVGDVGRCASRRAGQGAVPRRRLPMPLRRSASGDRSRWTVRWPCSVKLMTMLPLELVPVVVSQCGLRSLRRPTAVAGLG